LDASLLADRNKWPKAASRARFIWEAIEMIGQAKFGSTWDGSELHARAWRNAPAALLREERDRQREAEQSVSELFEQFDLSQRRPARSVICRPNPNHDQHVKARGFHLEELRLEAELPSLVAIWDQDQPAFGRLLSASEWLAQQCRDGLIDSFALITEPRDWGTIDPVEWFTRDVIGDIVSKGGWRREIPSGFAYVFIDGATLERALVALEHSVPKVSDVDLSAFSPRLQVAVALARKWNADKNWTPPKTHSLIADVQAGAREMGIDLTDSEAADIQKVLRHPDVQRAQAGRARAKAKNGGSGKG